MIRAMGLLFTKVQKQLLVKILYRPTKVHLWTQVRSLLLLKLTASSSCLSGQVLDKVTYVMALSLYNNPMREVPLFLFCFTDEETEEA